MPIGYEYGCNRKIDTLTSFDYIDYDKNTNGIKEYIKNINDIKKRYKIFNEETDIYIIEASKEEIFMYKKLSKDKEEEVLIIMNRNYNDNEDIKIEPVKNIINKENIMDISYGGEIMLDKNTDYFNLKAGEVKIIYGKN